MQLRTRVLPAMLMSMGLCMSSQVQLWTSHISLWSAPHNYHTFFFRSLEESGAQSWTQQLLSHSPTMLSCTVPCSTRIKIQRAVLHVQSCYLIYSTLLGAPDLASLLLYLSLSSQHSLCFPGKYSPSSFSGFFLFSTQIIS